MKHRIHLEPSACDRALGKAIERDTASRAAGLNSASSVAHRPQKRLEESVGCLAEVAFAQYLGDYDFVPGVNTFNLGDVGSFEVKGTTYEFGRLLFRPWENALARAYALVTIPDGISGAFDGNGIDAWIVGWKWGFECAQFPAEDMPGGRSPHPVPQSALNPFACNLFCCL